MLKLVNKIVLINGRRTSMRMSNKEWHAFDDVCKSENISMFLCCVIASSRLSISSVPLRALLISYVTLWEC